MRVVGVYNAKGSVWGELNYIFKKLSGRGPFRIGSLWLTSRRASEGFEGLGKLPKTTRRGPKIAPKNP